MKGFFLSLLFMSLFSVSLHAKAYSEMTEDIMTEYKTLMGYGSRYDRFDAVLELQSIYEDTGNMAVISVALYLLDTRYDYDDFTESDDQMFYDDLVAEALVEFLDTTERPEAFEVLMNIVVQRNHRNGTIKSAWSALQNIDWDLELQEDLIEEAESELF